MREGHFTIFVFVVVKSGKEVASPSLSTGDAGGAETDRLIDGLAAVCDPPRIRRSCDLLLNDSISFPKVRLSDLNDFFGRIFRMVSA